MPVCITGMHRSGTSLVANLLRLCGLYLGEAEDLLPATVDNTEGYWENRKFVLLNNGILREMGGAWDVPPPAGLDGWPRQERLNVLRIKAAILMREFANHEPWGWKDPRTSLTLPFWTSLDALVMPFWLGFAPKLKIVLCLRDPLEVFQSLRDRNFTPNSSGLDLWFTYNQNILNTTLAEDRIITHYEAYFQDAGAELTRVLEFLHIKVSPRVIEDSTRIISKHLRHKHSSFASMEEGNVSPKVINLYKALCEEANYLRDLDSYTSSTSAS